MDVISIILAGRYVRVPLFFYLLFQLILRQDLLGYTHGPGHGRTFMFTVTLETRRLVSVTY